MWIRIQRSREVYNIVAINKLYLVPIYIVSLQVKQGWLSTIGTAIIALAQSVYITLADMPDLIICNGPGNTVLFHYPML